MRNWAAHSRTRSARVLRPSTLGRRAAGAARQTTERSARGCHSSTTGLFAPTHRPERGLRGCAAHVPHRPGSFVHDQDQSLATSSDATRSAAGSAAPVNRTSGGRVAAPERSGAAISRRYLNPLHEGHIVRALAGGCGFRTGLHRFEHADPRPTLSGRSPSHSSFYATRRSGIDGLVSTARVAPQERCSDGAVAWDLSVYQT